ncbi:AraC family transcriptional regulator [Paenibacillus campi]|uniref:helix-turn-helix transcriptional regulator n=1 Tax=Paenibacillus campi TaxID=3106031 RepID=UPI002AFEA027|nr:AraC family transcriptional regulator [Paenibacillus sp. SGZ-1009]
MDSKRSEFTNIHTNLHMILPNMHMTLPQQLATNASITSTTGHKADIHAAACQPVQPSTEETVPPLSVSASLYTSRLAHTSARPQFYAYYYKQWQRYEMDYHQHRSTEIMYMIAGNCRIELLPPATDGAVSETTQAKGTVDRAVSETTQMKEAIDGTVSETTQMKEAVDRAVHVAGQAAHGKMQTKTAVDEATQRMTKAEVIELQRGQFILIDAEVPHRLIVGEQPCRMLNLEFGLRLDESDISTLSPPATTILQQLARQEDDLAAMIGQPQRYSVLSDPEEVYYTLKSLVLELDQRGGTSMLSELLFAQLLVRIARLWREHEQSRSSQSERYVRQSIEFMRQNYDRSIRMEQIAAAVNVHPGYLHRVFRKHMDTTPTEYLNTLRMEKAMMLLGSTDIPIAEIADYVGVTSRQYFHLLFKKHTGQTPADYRKTMEHTQWSDS